MTKFTEEHKRKISEALKRGQLFKCEICKNEFWRKPSAIRKGDNRFCSRECYYKWQKGKPKSVKNPYDKSGDGNPNWRGGISTENKLLRNSKQFQAWRKSIFERDDYTCQKCGARSKANAYIRIEAHHIKPFANYPGLRFDIDNGITLCKKCHSEEPKGREIWKIK